MMSLSERSDRVYSNQRLDSRDDCINQGVSIETHHAAESDIDGELPGRETLAGAEAYRKDLKLVEFHMLNAGHFALETNAAEIAGYIREFRPARE